LSPTDPLPNDWKNQLGDLKNRPTQEDLNKAVKKAEDKYKDYINPNNLNNPADKAKLEKAAKDAGFISPNDLENEAKKKGMVSKDDYDRVVRERDARANITQQQYQALLIELNDWKSKFPGKTPVDVKKEIDSKPATGGTVLSPDQQQKLNNYDKVITERDAEKRRKESLLKELKKRLSDERYAQIVVENNKIT